MRKARHIDISNRLETTRRLGLVEEFQIEWGQRTFCPPRITVRGRQNCHPQVTKNYVVSLLQQLVPARSIVVTQGV